MAAEKIDFNDETVKKAYEEKLKKYEQLAGTPVDSTEYLWNATVERYAVAMEKVKRLLNTEEIKGLLTTKILKDMDQFLVRCSSAEFHIALVGAIKAGKSTLINALLGYEYASTKITPETAVLTKFRKADQNYVKVSFYSLAEWDKLWKSAVDSKATVFLEEYKTLNADNEKERWLGKDARTFLNDTKEELVEEVYKWTSSKSSTHYFVKDVEVGLKDFELPQGVILVDTPGLDDVVAYRSDITREYIDRANAVLVCVKSDALTGPEMATIFSVFANTRYNPEKVYIIATQTDTLNRPVQNWEEQRKEWLKYLKERGAYASMELASRNLVPVSGYLYTLLKEFDSYDEKDERYWDLNSILSKLRIRMEDIHTHYQELYDFTNIELLKRKINTEVVANYQKLLVDDIVGSYQMCRDEIRDAMAKIKHMKEEVIKSSQGDADEIRRKQEEYTKKYKDAEEDKQELEKLISKLRRATQQRADELEIAIKNMGVK